MACILACIALYAAAAVALSTLRRAIKDREAFEMAIARQIKAHYDFNKRYNVHLRRP